MMNINAGMELSELLELFYSKVEVTSIGSINNLNEGLVAVAQRAMELGAAHGHFNGLSPAEHEALVVYMDQCAGAIQMACKILRHGIDSYHPVTEMNNRISLEHEMGSVIAAAKLVADQQLVNDTNIAEVAERKPGRLQRYLHHIQLMLE